MHKWLGDICGELKRTRRKRRRKKEDEKEDDNEDEDKEEEQVQEGKKRTRRRENAIAITENPETKERRMQFTRVRAAARYVIL